MRYLLILLLAASCQAATLCVKSGGTGTGTDWTTPLGSISSQASGNTYYVAAGTYSGNITISSSSQTIKKATVGDHGPSTGWNDSFASGQAVFSSCVMTISAPNFTLDGVTGGGP